MECIERFAARIGRTTVVLVVGLAPGCDVAGGVASTPGGGGPATGPTLISSLGVGSRTEFVTGIPGDVQAADLNGDGNVDLVQTNFLAQTVTIAHGNDDGSFTVAFRFETVGHAWRSALGDFDGDGRIDIATLCVSYLGGPRTPSLYMFRQAPAGVFASSAFVELETDGTFLTSAPINGVDGPEEVIVALPDVRELRRFQYRAGVVSVAGTLDTSSLPARGRPYSVAAVDWRGDGIIDLVVGEIGVAGGNPDRIVIFPRGGNGRLGFPSVLLEPVYEPILSAAGDVDGNGFDDVGIAQFRSDQALVLLSGGNGPAAVHALDFGGSTSSMEFGDFDDDGYIDVAATAFFDSAVHVRLAERPARWGAAARYYGGYLPRALAWIEVPGANRPGLLMSTAFDIGIITVRDDGVFEAPVGFASDREGPIGVATADLEGDGDQDVVTVSVGQAAVSFWRGAGDGTLELVRSEPMIAGPSDSPGALAVGDLNGDGRTDVLISVFAGDEVRLYDTVRGIDELDERKLSVPGAPRGVEIADFDGDGHLDFVVALTSTGAARVYLNAGQSGFTAQDRLSLSPPPVAVLPRDFDADGHMDLVVTASHTAASRGIEHAAIVLAGDGQGGLMEASRFPLAAFSTDLVAGDFDADGRIDIAIGQAGEVVEELVLAMNDGTLDFLPKLLPVGPFPKNVVSTDADGDGVLDLLIASATGDLRVAFGDGDGEFSRIEPMATPGMVDARGLPILFEVQDVAWSDMDGDGLNDLLMVAPNSPLVWILSNTSEPIDPR